MNKNDVKQLHAAFESILQTGDDIVFWFARDLQQLLGYTEWRNFITVVEKAKESCKNSGVRHEEHFVDVNKMSPLGNNAERTIDDIMLSRYACYLIAQNGDSRKQPIAFAQTYFALQTRKQEVLEERLEQQERLEARQKLTETEKQLSSTLYEHGVDDKGFGIIRSRGDQVLFGGKTTQDMKTRLGIKGTRPLADFLPTITLKAKEFAAAITSFNVKKDNLQGVGTISHEHMTNNQTVRNALLERKIKPEELPPEEDIRKLERRMEKQTPLPAPADSITKPKKGA